MRTFLAFVATTFLVLPLATASAQDTPWTLYVNPCTDGKGNVAGGGCQVTPGANNAQEYQSEIAQMSGVLTPFRRGDVVFANVLECVRQVYAPFNVNVVDTQPGPTINYHMAIVAGVPAEIGLPPTVGGRGNTTCDDPLTNRVSFTFDTWGNDVEQICATVAQESAHTFGLGHAFHCSDPMTYLPLCGRTFFRDANFQCGEFAAGNPQCRCSGPSQNSHRWLLGKLGANPVPVPGPTVSIDDLVADQAVQAGFRVTVTADHYRGLDRVEFWVNGTLRHTEDGPELGQIKNPWIWVTPQSMADGYIDFEIKAYNDIQSETIETVTVLKGAPCTTNDQCTESGEQYCEDGRCKFPIATGELGDKCVANSDCISNLCPLDGDSGFCSKECDPNSVLEQCGGDLECKATGATGVCWPKGGGCGCATGEGERAPLGGFLLVGLVALVLRRRRR